MMIFIFVNTEPAESTLQYAHDDYTSILRLRDHIRGKVRHVQMIHWMNGYDTNGGVQHYHRLLIMHSGIKILRLVWIHPSSCLQYNSCSGLVFVHHICHC